MNLEALVGKKVKITRGMDEKGQEEHQVWIAGIIPVGTVGTVEKINNGMYHIVWDDPKHKAKNGFMYAATTSTDFLEEV